MPDKTDYFAKRGLTAETVKKFCLGFDIHRNAVVLPYSSELTYYQTRSIADKKFYKPPTEEAGAEPLFNRKALVGVGQGTGLRGRKPDLRLIRYAMRRTCGVALRSGWDKQTHQRL